MPDTASPVAQVAFWALKQFGGGAISSGGGLVLGQVLSAIGVGGPSLEDIKSEIQKVQSALTEVSRKLDSISSQLDTLLVMVELTRTEINSRLEALKIWTPMETINAEFADLLAFDPAQAGTAHAREWAHDMAVELYKGKYDMDLQLRMIHDGIVGDQLGGFLASYTDHLLVKLRNGKISLQVAYDTLERLYGELLACQVHGLVLHTEALNYRDAMEKHAAPADTVPAFAAAVHAAPTLTAPAAGVWLQFYPHSAADYATKVFRSHMEQQVAVFLHCVDRLVLSRADLRTTFPRMPAFLPEDGGEVYRRADLLARCVSPTVHRHEVVTRLVGDPSWIERTVDHWLRQASALGTQLGPQLLPELIPQWGQHVTYVERGDLQLPAADFPAGEFLEWTARGCRPQTRLAVALFGRSSTEPRSAIHDHDGAVVSPEEWPNRSAGFQWFDASLRAMDRPRGDCFLLASGLGEVRKAPEFATKLFHEAALCAVDGQTVHAPDQQTLLTTTLLPEMRGRLVGAKFLVSERVRYEWADHWHATSAADYTFKYAIGTSDEAESVTLNHVVDVKAWVSEMYKTSQSTRQSKFVAATRKSDCAPGGAAIELKLRHTNTVGQCPWKKVYQPMLGPPKPSHPVLQQFWYWLDAVELTVMQGPA